jgi:hypothetical protein
MSTVFTKISDYLPHTTIRGLNKQLYQNDKEYCHIASHIYNSDMKLIENQENTITFYDDNHTYSAILNKNIVYKLKQVNEFIVLKITKKTKILNSIIDVDVMSKYKIFKSRGCEDMIENYSKNNTLSQLLKTFKNYFNPDVMIDMLYLYIYLHANCVLLGIYDFEYTRKKYNMNKLPGKNFLQEIYDMYNVLYVKINLL